MIISFKKAKIKCTITTIILIFLVGCSKSTPMKPTINGQNQTRSTITNKQNNNNTNSSSPIDSNSIVYINTEYGFNFSLPKSWQDYSIVTDKWQGTDIKSGKIMETGAIYSIRHPQWTSVKPRQDIPIMVFTLAQWELISQEKLSLGAAPIGPSELGRNSSYVFALPARYNFAYQIGYEEVEKILVGKPLKPT